MVIQMVACQIGIRGRSDDQTVEPELVKSVARSFDSHMLDPLSCELGQIAVQGYRVRRSQGSGAMRGGGHQTERPEAVGRRIVLLTAPSGALDLRRLLMRSGRAAGEKVGVRPHCRSEWRPLLHLPPVRQIRLRACGYRARRRTENPAALI